MNVVSLVERRERQPVVTDEPLKSKRQIADYFSVSISTVDRWMRKGLEPAARLWGSDAPRFRVSEVAEWHARR